MILLSPISSGIKLVDIASTKDLKKIKPIDQNRNLQDINCSVFLIHGLLDSVIPCKFTDNMKKRLIKSMSWFPTHGDHTNILTKYRDEFYTKCLNFLNSMNYNFMYEASQYNDGKHRMTDLELLENYIRNVSTSQTNCLSSMEYDKIISEQQKQYEYLKNTK